MAAHVKRKEMLTNLLTMKPSFPSIFFMAIIAARTCGQAPSPKFDYPIARTEAFDTTIFGIHISDPYYWMGRDAHREEMLEYSRKQGELARTVLDSITGNDILEVELGNLFGAMQEKDDIWNVHAVNGSVYYSRVVPGAGTTLCRRAGMDAPEEPILKGVRINGKRYVVRQRLFAHKKPLMALMLTESGENNPHLRIFDLDKKEFLPDSIGPVMFNDSRGASIAWSQDDNSLFYSQSPASEVFSEKYYNGVIKQHRIGEDYKYDVPLFGNGQHSSIAIPPEETPYVYTFPNSPYIVVRIRSAWGDGYAYSVNTSDLAGRDTPWNLIKDYSSLGDAFDANGTSLYAATVGPSGYKIMKYDVSGTQKPTAFYAPVPDEIAGTDGTFSKAIIAGKDVIYVLMRRIGDMYINRIDPTTGEVQSLPLPKKSSFANLQLLKDNDLLFCELSPIKADKYHWYDYQLDKAQPLSFAENTLDFADELKTEVIFVKSRDGEEIPVSVVYAKTTNIQDQHRWLIESYGFSGASKDLYFDPYVYPWIKMGGVYAYAHVRGEGGKGYRWYKDGDFPKKHNSINDLVDVADWLVSSQHALPGQVMIMGASGGSILVGNALNQRPDLFAGGVFIVGLPDLATYSDAASAREGNRSMGPKNTPKGFASNYQHSALYHIPQGKDLPAVLIIHGATDYILGMSPAARYAARLQEAQRGERPILFWVQWEGGHSTSNENEPIDILKFALWQTGHPEFHLKR
jgi:prolyl oligopeptidase